MYLGSGPVVTPPIDPPTPAAAPTIVGLTGSSPSAGVVALKWTTPLPAVGTLTCISTSGRQPFPVTGTIPAGATSVTVINVHPGWQIDMSITAGTESSGVATVSVLGVSTAPYTGNPTLAPTLVGVETIVINYFSDGTQKTVSDTTVKP
jgi:hypothetical protein